MPLKRLAATERAEAIVRATITVFAAGGSAGATTREIARAAGVSEALVFRHFPTKESLYRAVLRHKIAEAERFLPLDGALRALDDEGFFLRIATLFLDRVQEDATFTRLFLYCGLEGHDLTREFYRARTERLIAAIEERLAAMTGRKKKLSDAAITARSFYGLVFGVMVSKFILGDRILRRTPNARIAASLVGTFLDGVRCGKAAA